MSDTTFALQWEKLANEGTTESFTTERARVFGGWLVRVTVGASQSLAFVPDGEFRWDGEDFGEDDYEYEEEEEGDEEDEEGEEEEEDEDDE
jgi:hypothetical protein